MGERGTHTRAHGHMDTLTLLCTCYFFDSQEVPMLKERHQVLQEIGTVLLEVRAGHVDVIGL